MLIQVKKLKKNFHNLEVLKGIDFTVDKGEKVVILGSSGSGKSTALRCINLLEQPSSGEIIYNNNNILDKGYDINKHRQKAGMHALFLVIIVKNENLVFVNIAYTIALLELVEIISMILGGVYQINIYKKMSLKNNVVIEMIIFIFYVLNIIYLQNKFILIILTTIIGYLAGISNPKLDALILQSVPEDKQTSIFSIFSTLITLTVPIGTVIILFISNVFSANIALYTLLILLLILTVYSFKIKEK